LAGALESFNGEAAGFPASLSVDALSAAGVDTGAAGGFTTGGLTTGGGAVGAVATGLMGGGATDGVTGAVTGGFVAPAEDVSNVVGFTAGFAGLASKPKNTCRAHSQ